MAKKLVLIVGLFFIVLTSSSCYDLYTAYDEIYRESSGDEIEMREAMFAKILSALEERDTEGMEELFSIYAKTKTLYLEHGIERAMDFYEGQVISCEGGHSLFTAYHYGSVARIITAFYWVTTDKNTYRLAFVYCPRNDEERTMLGLYALQIADESFARQESFFRVNENSRPGVYIQRSSLTEEELKERERRFRSLR